MQILASSVGWKLSGPSLTLEVGLVGRLADARQARQEQQGDARERDQVAIALQDLVVAQEDDRQRERHQSHHEPVRLVPRQPVVEAEQHHHAERGQQRHEREQEGIGVGKPGPDHEVGRQAQPKEIEAVDEAEIPDLLGLDDQHGGESRRHQQADGDQREELAAARAQLPLAGCCFCLPAAPCFFSDCFFLLFGVGAGGVGGTEPSRCSMSSMMSVASSSERSLCSVTTS